jgi:hypothetical protein
LLTSSKLYYGSNILFLIALALSKASVAALLVRLCVDKTQKRFFIAALAFVGLWLIASIVAVALQCDLPRPWILLDGKCHGIVSTFQRKRAHTNVPLMLRSYYDGKSSADWISRGKYSSLRWPSLWFGVCKLQSSSKYKWYRHLCSGFREYRKEVVRLCVLRR